MGDDRIRVNPASVEAYGRNAQEQFDAMHTSLVQLVNECTTVDYYGENATQFKTKCGQTAADFALAFSKDLSAIADAVRTSTSNISQALGGRAISISVNGSAVPLPAIPPGDGSLEVSTGALSSLMPSVASRIGSVSQALDEHLQSLRQTDWQGNAKDQAVSAVSSYTAKAKQAAVEAQSNITRFIQDQLDLVSRADA